MLLKAMILVFLPLINFSKLNSCFLLVGDTISIVCILLYIFSLEHNNFKLSVLMISNYTL